MPKLEYGIVAGWNGTPVNVETIAVPSAVPLSDLVGGLDANTHYLVKSVGQYDIPFQFTPSGATQNGYAIQKWSFGAITTIAYKYLYDTYGQFSSQAGKVTINTRLDTETYVEKNARLFAPMPNTLVEYSRRDVKVYENLEVTLYIVGDTA